VEAHLLEWARLGARWLHVLAGAVWIGTSFYFTWLNHALRPPEGPRGRVAGELWSVHGGGFYRVDKFDVAPERLPSTLHWFKWEAYTTWLSGAALLVLVYYMGSGALLVDPDGPVGRGAATAVAAGAIVVGWFVYDMACRSPLGRRPAALAVAGIVFTAATAYALSTVLSDRAAYLHTGAMLGTWMAANVFFVIIPGQRAMVEAMEAGREPDAEKGRQGAMRSLHNNYLTLPVLYAMVSIHYPVTYAPAYGWAILALVFVVGIAARRYYNLRHGGRKVRWLLPAAIVALVAVPLVTAPWGETERRTPMTSEGVAEPVARAIVEARCVPCHAERPSHPSTGGMAPLGIRLDTAEAIAAHHDRARIAVESGTMPLGNLTGMTDEERAVLVRWLREGGSSEVGR